MAPKQGQETVFESEGIPGHRRGCRKAIKLSEGESRDLSRRNLIGAGVFARDAQEYPRYANCPAVNAGQWIVMSDLLLL
jgi:hypothetical protein